jgi:hypothetical protein
VTTAPLNAEFLPRAAAWSWLICAATGQKAEDPASRFAVARRLLLMAGE